MRLGLWLSSEYIWWRMKEFSVVMIIKCEWKTSRVRPIDAINLDLWASLREPSAAWRLISVTDKSQSKTRLLHKFASSYRQPGGTSGLVPIKTPGPIRATAGDDTAPSNSLPSSKARSVSNAVSVRRVYSSAKIVALWSWRSMWSLTHLPLHSEYLYPLLVRGIRERPALSGDKPPTNKNPRTVRSCASQPGSQTAVGSCSRWTFQ